MSGNMVLLTGKTLEDYCSAFLTGIDKRRDFVSAILEYISSPESNRRVLAISGLKGTGKTTGVFQAIQNISNYNNTLLISVEDDVDISVLKEVIIKNLTWVGYIFVDEVTRVKGLISGSAFLADTACGCGKKVVISGTDSLALVGADNASLYHGVITKNVTYISFEEAKRTTNQSLKEYIELGGYIRLMQ